MSILQKGAMIILFALPCIHYAAELPIATIGAEPFNLRACIQQTTQDCLKSVCIESSPTNCAAQCHYNAEQKCQSLTEQQL